MKTINYIKPLWAALVKITKPALMLYVSAGILLSLSVIACRQAVPDASVHFGNVVTAANIDSNNAPTALADVFSSRQSAIYVVIEARDIAPGTRLSANWLREGTVVQVSNEVIATQGYHNTNIEFHMNPGSDGWLTGNYSVQILENGQVGANAKFTVK